jgi:hypothetical protein
MGNSVIIKGMKRPKTYLTSDYERLAVAKKLATLLDAAFTLPIINKKIGLDPILGLFPGIGDAVSLVISLYIVYTAHQLGLPRTQLVLMLVNVALDTAIGSVPVLGDTFDAFWKSNMKNIAVIEQHLQKGRGSIKPSQRSVGGHSKIHPGDQTIDLDPPHRQKDTF